jgi:CelD/BcsL family acetyltransferase involved in cellulose biosynthesis
VVSVRISGVGNFAALGERWRDLERRADGSFFQSWTWVGCLAPERFPDAILVEATDAGRTVALGLFNRVRRRFGLPALYLGENGSGDLDCPYVEQNGFLTEAGRVEELTALCLRPLVAAHDVVLSGVGMPALAAVRRTAGIVLTERSQPAPFIDLAGVRHRGGDYLAERSANTRQQLRRSDRFYERDGPIRVDRAQSVPAARAMLDRLADLHQASWIRRGQPGSFAIPFFRRFHAALIESGLPRGEVALLSVSSGETVIGFLYNFVLRDRMVAYQSGFAYSDEASHAKPGLTCHLAAIRYALGQGIDIYNLLAGDSRYKRSLSDHSEPQFWLRAGPRWSPRLLPHALFRLRQPKARLSADLTVPRAQQSA